jgi:hypothetical protein
MTMNFSIPRTPSPRLTRSFPVPLSLLALALLAFTALFSYGYSLRTAISFAVEREDIMEEIAKARASITALDSKYVSLTNGLSITHAKSLGFHEVVEPIYISINPGPENVGLRAR